MRPDRSPSRSIGLSARARSDRRRHGWQSGAEGVCLARRLVDAGRFVGVHDIHAEIGHDTDDLQPWILVRLRARGPAHTPPDRIGTSQHTFDEGLIHDDGAGVIVQVAARECSAGENRLVETLEVSDIDESPTHAMFTCHGIGTLYSQKQATMIHSWQTAGEGNAANAGMRVHATRDLVLQMRESRLERGSRCFSLPAGGRIYGQSDLYSQVFVDGNAILGGRIMENVS